MMGVLRFSPQVLDWAASQSGSTLPTIAARLSKRNPTRIEEGELTDAQALRFSKLVGVPFGYLFLDQPPAARKLPIADFRVPQDAEPLDRDFYDVYDDIVFKQAWYKDYLVSISAPPLDFVGRYGGGVQVSIAQVAMDIRETLGISQGEVARLSSAAEHFAYLSARCEGAGVLVFKNGVVGNNTRRPLSEKQFRGFVLSDELAPVIFINGADASAAWIFTLGHELAHLWYGESGVSDTVPMTSNMAEQRCNAVAAELLVPRVRFLEQWRNNSGDVRSRIDLARLAFKVSALVIARRALDLKLIPQSVYGEIAAQSKKQKKRESGGDFYLTLATRNSKRFASRVASLAVSGEITYREAGRLLNTSPRNVPKFYAKSQ